MDRSEILARLNEGRRAGRALLAAGAGTGGVAQAAEKGGVDFIVIYNSGMYRSHGASSLAGMMPYGDANAIVMSMGAKILPAVSHTPVLAGVCGTDPFRSMPRFLREIKDMGFAGVQNFPTVGLIDGRFRHDLEATGIRFQQEVDMIAHARELDLLTCAFVCDEESAVDMANAGVDIIAPHLGVSIPGSDLDAAVERIQSMADASAAVAPDSLILFHGGPATSVDEVRYMLERLAGVDGYFGASSIERTPVVDAVSRATREFASIAVEFESPDGLRPEVQLDRSTLPGYLEAHGLAPRGEPVELEELGGGISNVLVRYRAGEHVAVLKQSRPQIQVEMEWLCDVRRILVEREAIETIRALLPVGSVPKVTYHDDANYLFVMSSAPDDARLWKTDLLNGDVNESLFTVAGRQLAAIHRGTAQDDQLRRRFGVGMLSQLRVEPYFQSTAKQHPELSEKFKEAIRVTVTSRTCLVHGDYVPKNMLVLDEDSLMLLDYEIVHFGNPAYDLATFVNHVLLKSFGVEDHTAEFVTAAKVFVESYVAAGGLPISQPDVLLLLGCLMLARVDGKSPVEYLPHGSQKAAVRAFARAILVGEVSSVEDVFAHRMGLARKSEKEVRI